VSDDREQLARDFLEQLVRDRQRAGGKYILDADGNPQPCDDLLAWARWFEAASRDRTRIVAQDLDESDPKKTIKVSTVFLGLDHNFMGDGTPVLWETLVMGGLLDGEMDRYTSRAAALEGHQAMCRRVLQTIHKQSDGNPGENHNP
jgi:hypothetical protein